MTFDSQQAKHYKNIRHIRLNGMSINTFFASMPKTATLHIPHKQLTIELPVHVPVLGQDTIDISTLVEDHRVYKNKDPRAIAMKKSCEKILQKLGDSNDPLLVIAKKLEVIALSDEYFIERKLFPNVDFYSGIILKALNIPINFYTLIFALARTSG